MTRITDRRLHRTDHPKVAGKYRLRNCVGRRSMNNSELLIYQAPDGQIKIDVRLEEETVWLTQVHMAQLFGKSKKTISEHIRNIFTEGELDKNMVVRKFRTTTRHGAIKGKTQSKDVQFYTCNMGEHKTGEHAGSPLREPPQRKKRRTIRLRGYDYSQAGAYFVTICTQNRECFFGDIVNGEMVLNASGECVADKWQWLGHHHDFVELDEWVIMPNHMHGIIVIVDDGRGGSRTAPTRLRNCPRTRHRL